MQPPDPLLLRACTRAAKSAKHCPACTNHRLFFCFFISFTLRRLLLCTSLPVLILGHVPTPPTAVLVLLLSIDPQGPCRLLLGPPSSSAVYTRLRPRPLSYSTHTIDLRSEDRFAAALTSHARKMDVAPERPAQRGRVAGAEASSIHGRHTTPEETGQGRAGNSERQAH